MGPTRQGYWEREGALNPKRGVQYSHGSLLMNWGPALCWDVGGLGVPTSLLLAILVLALANSSLRVWGISGSKRTPCSHRRHMFRSGPSDTAGLVQSPQGGTTNHMTLKVDILGRPVLMNPESNPTPRPPKRLTVQRPTDSVEPQQIP
ncbi:hypothetical protein JZ751_005835 [Albula glossodonta]|uniref:Uncharacterized protein n=1 Tax=Albula glossodonta TaxID=121402 RepID=A0A8T2PBL7_9TELE|nr:hypothetical protein JZ751_005835 [Albula glossodonta]